MHQRPRLHWVRQHHLVYPGAVIQGQQIARGEDVRRAVIAEISPAVDSGGYGGYVLVIEVAEELVALPIELGERVHHLVAIFVRPYDHDLAAQRRSRQDVRYHRAHEEQGQHDECRREGLADARPDDWQETPCEPGYQHVCGYRHNKHFARRVRAAEAVLHHGHAVGVEGVREEEPQQRHRRQAQRHRARFIAALALREYQERATRYHDPVANALEKLALAEAEATLLGACKLCRVSGYAMTYPPVSARYANVRQAGAGPACEAALVAYEIGDLRHV